MTKGALYALLVVAALSIMCGVRAVRMYRRTRTIDDLPEIVLMGAISIVCGGSVLLTIFFVGVGALVRNVG